MTLKFSTALTMSCAVMTLAWSAAYAQEAPSAEPASPEAVADTPAEEAPAISEDEMADLLNSKQQISQGVTLTRTLDGKVIETRKETVVYSKDDPLLNTEAGMSPLEKLKAEFDSSALTRKEALEEAKLDFVVADLDRDNQMSADEFIFLVKGWEDAEISGTGRGRFVDPYFHVDPETAAAEHAEQARSKFAAMAGEDTTLSKKSFSRRIVEEFEEHDKDRNEILQGDELLNFRASVRGEPILPE